MKRLDIIVPCFNEESCVNPFYDEVIRVMRDIPDMDLSIIYVDDGGTDDTLTRIKQLAAEDNRIQYISLSRNFGKEAAIYAGLSMSSGDLVVIMDVDLQHPPKILPAMIDNINQGYDCCAAGRSDRCGEPIFRSAFSNMFYSLVNKISSVKIDKGATDFRMMTKRMVESLLEMEERERFSKGLMSWVGFKVVWIEFENIERTNGNTKWSFFGLFKYAVSGIVAFSTAPLRLATIVGSIVVTVSFIYAVYIAIMTLILDTDVPGYASLLATMIFLGGIIILFLGIIGEYIARLYIEIKRRPIYIVKEQKRNTEEL